MYKLKSRHLNIPMMLLAAAFTGTAAAGHDQYVDYARVIAAQPVYERVAHSVPSQECRVEQVRYEYPGRRESSATGTLVGTMLGAAVGHQVGRDKEGKKIGRVAGAILGASIGSDASRRGAPARVEYHNEKRCDTVYSTHYTQELVGYDVSYEYNGKIYHTRTDRDPGREMQVAVDVRPYRY